MLNVGRIEEGFVLDHIKAGKAMTIYHDLGLDKLDCTVAIIKNAKSEKMGKKDILKVECSVDKMDLDILGFIDHNITVNVIKDGEITEKKELHLPKQVVDVIKCKNPRCITSIEQGLKHVFILADPEKEVYRFVGIAQHHGMVRIRCHATQSEQQQRFQRANVLLRLPELVHVVILVLAARRCAGSTLRHKSALFPMHPVDLRLDGIVIEVDIGQRHEQAFDHQFIRLRCCQSRIAVQRSCQTDQRSGQLVL